MIMTNNNSISTLFGSYNATGMSSLLSDYSSIKNGSYGKLLKSYYNVKSGSSGKSGSGSGSTSDVLSKILEEKKNPTVSKEVKEANSTLSQGVTDVKSAISSLQTESTYEDTNGGSSAKDKVKSAVKNYVDNYNSMVNASKKSTNSGMTSSVAEMMKNTSASKSELENIGIMVNKDGTLSVNEKRLQATDLTEVKEVFSSENRNSYGSKIAGRATTAGYYSGDSSLSVSSDQAEKIEKASANASDLKTSAKNLASEDLFAKVKDSEGNETEEYDLDKITSAVKSFISSYNDTVNSASKLTNSGVASNIGNILSKTKDNADALAGFGISVSKSGTLSLNAETFKNADMAEAKKFFKDYGSSVSSFASLVDYYSSTQANASSGYLANGAYNTQAMSSFTDTM